MKKIQKWSRIMRIFFQIVFIVIPIVALITSFSEWIFPDQLLPSDVSEYAKGMPHPPVTMETPYFTRIQCFMLSLIPSGIAMFGFYHLIRLFKLYELGRIFDLESINHMKVCAYSVLVWVLADLGVYVFEVLALTINNPVGERLLSFAFTLTHFSTFVIAVIAIIITQVMDEARKLKDENDYIV